MMTFNQLLNKAVPILCSTVFFALFVPAVGWYLWHVIFFNRWYVGTTYNTILNILAATGFLGVVVFALFNCRAPQFKGHRWQISSTTVIAGAIIIVLFSAWARGMSW